EGGDGAHWVPPDRLGRQVFARREGVSARHGPTAIERSPSAFVHTPVATFHSTYGEKTSEPDRALLSLDPRKAPEAVKRRSLPSQRSNAPMPEALGTGHPRPGTLDTSA